MKYLILGLLVTTTAFATCQTNSNGYSFNHDSRSEDFSRRKTLESCKASAYTDNKECEVNLVCDSDPQRYPVQCDTISNNYRFQSVSLDRGFSLDETIKKCQASAYTDNAECTVNLTCDDGRQYSDYKECHTSSNNYQFQFSSRSAAFSADKTLEKCKASAYTDNEECEVNLECGR